MTTGRLVRSTTDRKIAGVCGGMAAYFNMDVTLMRILWVIGVIAGFPVVGIIYLVLWMALPEGAAEPALPASSAIQIAEERFARGEISAEEMARIREDLAK